MEVLARVVDFLFPDGIIYALVAIVFLVGLVKCCRPVYRNAAALRRAADLLKEGAKAKLGRPVWGDPNFLGKELQPVWRAYLQSAEMGAASGVSSDVAEYVHEDAIVTEPGKASLAETIPGLCTSLGILGTFIGLVMGLNGLDFMDPNSAVQLTNGIAFAFMTSIVGIIASFIFNVLYKSGVGRAYASLDKFTAAFYHYGVPQPPDATAQLLTYEREQADALTQFSQDLSIRMASEIQHAFTVALEPLQESMDSFLHAATRAQVEGLDYIVARFVDKMNRALDGQLKELGASMQASAHGTIEAQEKLRGIVSSIGELTDQVVQVHTVSEQLISKFAGYVDHMDGAYKQITETQEDAADLLEQIGKSSDRQAKYLSALQEYQAKLQGSFQDYTVWTDKFVGGLEERTTVQNVTLDQINMEMRATGELLGGAYRSFTESIELGLANALGLFDENMQTLMKQVNGTLEDINGTMKQLDKVMEKTAKKLPGKQEVT